MFEREAREFLIVSLTFDCFNQITNDHRYVSGNSNRFGELGLGLKSESKDLTRNVLVTSHMDRKEMELKVMQEIRRRVRSKYEKKEEKKEEKEEEKIEDGVKRRMPRHRVVPRDGGDGGCVCVGCVVM